jgi:hypothetical protein
MRSQLPASTFAEGRLPAGDVFGATEMVSAIVMFLLVASITVTKVDVPWARNVGLLLTALLLTTISFVYRSWLVKKTSLAPALIHAGRQSGL